MIPVDDEFQARCCPVMRPMALHLFNAKYFAQMLDNYKKYLRVGDAIVVMDYAMNWKYEHRHASSKTCNTVPRAAVPCSAYRCSAQYRTCIVTYQSIARRTDPLVLCVNRVIFAREVQSIFWSPAQVSILVCIVYRYETANAEDEPRLVKDFLFAITDDHKHHSRVSRLSVFHTCNQHIYCTPCYQENVER